jgi:hypothetical protein
VAEALGLKPIDVLGSNRRDHAQELPDLPDEVEEPDDQSTRVL